MSKREALLIVVLFLVLVWLPVILIIAGISELYLLGTITLCMLFAIGFGFKYGSKVELILQVIVGKLHKYTNKKSSNDVICNVISKSQEAELEGAIKISFTGDLILLREMVERAYNSKTGEYEFDEMFEHVNHLWKRSDLAIGIFEGPLCGPEYGYSTSNYGDNVPLALNYPDSFAEAIKRAGINLVSLANNHIFDMGIDGGLRTLRVLNDIGLEHVGLSSNEHDYNKLKIIEVCGKRIGVLAYTFGQNGKPDSFFFEESQYYLRPVVKKRSKYFKRNVALVERDFKKLRDLNPDLIIVIPHMGEQFLNKPDKTQQAWNKIFCNLGADIILGDHAHHVQPIEWGINKFGKRTLIINCPGNFINSYVNFDGDASMIVTAYLDRGSLSPFAVSITPIYSYCRQNGKWIGLPTYKAILDPEIRDVLSRADFRRINEVNRIVTRDALGAPLDVDVAQEDYIKFFNTGILRRRFYGCNMQKYSDLGGG